MLKQNNKTKHANAKTEKREREREREREGVRTTNTLSEVVHRKPPFFLLQAPSRCVTVSCFSQFLSHLIALSLSLSLSLSFSPSFPIRHGVQEGQTAAAAAGLAATDLAAAGGWRIVGGRETVD